jgi:DNA-binding beta-propeller fold protein YncE
VGLAVAAVALGGGLVGCGGGSGSTTFPRAAEPAESPAPASPPAGHVVRIGGEPEGLAFDPAAGKLAVGLRAPARLAFVDPRSLAIAHEVRLPGAPRHLAYSPATRSVIVPAESADAAVSVATDGRIASTAKVGTHPHDAVAVGDDVFVADEHSDQISVVRDGRTVATLPTPHQPGGIAAVGDRYVVLVAVSQRTLAVYDARTMKELGETSAGVGPSHVVTLGDDAFVADTQGDRVREYRISAQPRQIASAPTPGGTPYGLAIDAARRRLWVTLTGSDQLAEFRIGRSGPRRIATYPTVRQPNSVEVDPRDGVVYVAGRTGGQLERIVPQEGGPR